MYLWALDFIMDFASDSFEWKTDGAVEQGFSCEGSGGQPIQQAWSGDGLCPVVPGASTDSPEKKPILSGQHQEARHQAKLEAKLANIRKAEQLLEEKIKRREMNHLRLLNAQRIKQERLEEAQRLAEQKKAVRDFRTSKNAVSKSLKDRQRSVERSAYGEFRQHQEELANELKRLIEEQMTELTDDDKTEARRLMESMGSDKVEIPTCSFGHLVPVPDPLPQPSSTAEQSSVDYNDNQVFAKIVSGAEVPGLRPHFSAIDFSVGEQYVQVWTPPPLSIPQKKDHRVLQFIEMEEGSAGVAKWGAHLAGRVAKLPKKERHRIWLAFEDLVEDAERRASEKMEENGNSTGIVAPEDCSTRDSVSPMVLEETQSEERKLL